VALRGPIGTLVPAHDERRVKGNEFIQRHHAYERTRCVQAGAGQRRKRMYYH
jgi:hypothetical protein